MVGAARQAIGEAGGVHLVLYDGVCGVCSRLVQFLLSHDRRAAFDFASLQSPTGQTMVERFGGNPRQFDSFYVIANYRTAHPRPFTQGRAALVVARELGWPWRAFSAAGVLPTVVLDSIYALVARNRYRLFGRSETCVVPGPDVRHRFVE